MRHLIRLIIVTALPILILSACNTGGTDEEATPTTESVAAEPTQATGEGEVTTGAAPVDSLEILVLESFPVQVNVIASGSLPDSCTRLEEPIVEQVDNSFNIVLPTSRPADLVCTQALEPYDKVIQLDVEGLPAGTYTVTVNGVSDSFSLAVDNSLEAAEPLPTPDPSIGVAGTGAISGQVWHDLCAVSGGEGGEPAVPSDGCVSTSGGGYQANGFIEAVEPGITGLQVSLGAGACPATGTATTLTDSNGFYSFTSLQPGTYCVSIDPLVEPNVSILIPGTWTFPPGDGVVEAEVAVNANQVSPAINFGWDYQFLPEPDDVPDEPVVAPPDRGCTDAADFVTETVPDDTVISAGTTFSKSWTLINTGTCTWNTDYALVFADGEQMDGPDAVPININVPPGSVIELSVSLTAPTVNGTYRGDWQLRNDVGTTFGIPEPDVVFWVQIVVQNGTEPEALSPWLLGFVADLTRG